MIGTTLMLALIAVAVGAFPPTQAGLNATLARHYGHPLWGALTNTVVASALLGLAILVTRAPLPDWKVLAQAPIWSWFGGLLGAGLVLSAILIAPRLGAAGYVTAMTVGTVAASLAIDHFGLVGFATLPINPARLAGGALVVAGMVLVQAGR